MKRVLETLSFDPIAIGSAEGITFLAGWIPFILLAIISPKIFRVFIADIRVLRLLHYILLLILGVALLYHSLPDPGIFPLESKMLIRILLGIQCIIYAAIFAIVINNIHDIESDRISNPARPLVKNHISINTYFRIGAVSLFISLFLASRGGFALFAGIAVISLVYFLYSAEPFRLKKIPILSKLLIGINSFAITVAGFVIAGGEILSFPIPYLVFCLVALGLSANFVDLKDTEGDRKVGVITLPVWLGQKNARRLISVFTVCTYLYIIYLLPIPLTFYFIVPACIIHLYFLNREPFDERPVFAIYLSGILAMDIALFALK